MAPNHAWRDRFRPGPNASPDPMVFAAAVSETAALVRAGLGPAEAWEPLLGHRGMSGDIASDLRKWHDSFKDGPIMDYADAVIAAQRVCERVGAPLADVLEAVADAIEDRVDAAAKAEAAMSAPQATARVVSFLPLIGLMLGTAIGAHPLSVLFGGGLGTGIGVLGGGLMAAGWLWSRRLIGRVRWKAGLAGILTLELLGAVLRAGVPIAQSLVAVGREAGGPVGLALADVGERLTAGTAWSAAWKEAERRFGLGGQSARGAAGESAHVLAGAERALGLAWRCGVSPAPLLAGVVRQLRRSARQRVEVAAGKVGVYLMAPLGLCYLPAFVALGLVPIVISLAGQLFGR